VKVSRRVIRVLLGVLGFAAICVGAGSPPVLAQEITNEMCLACHAAPGMQTTLPSGEVLYLTVNPLVYDSSVHGERGMLCIHCHTNITGYPHPEITVSTRRDLSLQLYRASCIHCHPAHYGAVLDSVHQVALAGGHQEAAICTDCHGTHNIQEPDEPRSRSSQMCELCHAEIFELYKSSVHGAALLGEGNPDVPACIDCHQVHNITQAATSEFHLFSPDICAGCHADEELMAKYDISTDVFDTYVSDFHGTTVLLFQSIAPGQETNKPVCIDCHGVHDMRAVDDPESQVIKENLLATCQKCHPDATANFPTTWVSHYRPSPEHAPLVFFVNIFYYILIPGVLGFMVLFVATDIRKKIVGRKER
jgi:hypothetical protein